MHATRQESTLLPCHALLFHITGKHNGKGSDCIPLEASDITIPHFYKQVLLFIYFFFFLCNDIIATP